MYTNITALSNNYTPNTGGIRSARFIPKEWLAEELKTDRISRRVNQIKLMPGKTWLPLAALYETMEYIEKTKQSNAGQYYEATLTGIMMKDSEDLGNQMNILPFHEFIIQYTDYNGVSRIIGNKTTGMRFAADYNTDDKTTGNTRYRFTFSIELSERAPLLSPFAGNPSGP